MAYEYLEWFKYPTCACLNLTDSCNLACRYCVDGDTLILMHDGTTKPIRDIEIGDMVIGTEEQVERYHQFSVFPTKVLQLHNRKVEELLVITFEDGKTIKITPNHRVLNGRHKWTESGNLQQGTGIVMSANLWHENDTPDIINDINYIKGYFLAMWLTDGSFNYY